MDQQALAAKLKHPTVKSFKNKPRHGHFNADDESKAYTISVWCHSKYDNVFYYTSNGFDDMSYLSLFMVVNDAVLYRHSTGESFSEDTDADAPELLEELRRIRFSYLLDKKLGEQSGKR